MLLVSYNLLSNGWRDLSLICSIQKAGKGTGNCSCMANTARGEGNMHVEGNATREGGRE